MAAPTSGEGKRIVQRLFDGIDDHDLGVMDELLAADVTTGIHRSGSDHELGGREDVKSLWKEYWEAFPDLEGVSTELIAEGDRVAFFREERGTHEGAFRGIEPTGNEIEFESAGYFVIEDGQVVHANAMGSIASLLEQMGVALPLEA